MLRMSKKTIEIVQPYGVDVESRIEYIMIDRIGKKVKVKNVVKIREFINVVRECKYG